MDPKFKELLKAAKYVIENISPNPIAVYGIEGLEEAVKAIKAFEEDEDRKLTDEMATRSDEADSIYLNERNLT